MASYLVKVGGVCTNVIEWDGVSTYDPGAGATLILQQPGYSFTDHGTASVTNGSPSVTLSGAALQTDGVVAGRKITIGDSPTVHTIASIDSETGLTLNANYDGSTNASTNFYIAPFTIGDTLP